ncbi:MAG: hypothetical protein WBD31_05675 [Rubripirellula sp.]
MDIHNPIVFSLWRVHRTKPFFVRSRPENVSDVLPLALTPAKCKDRSRRPAGDRGLFVLLVAVVLFAAGMADAGSAEITPIKVSSLPKPPEKIAAWIKQGNVSFESGTRPPSRQSSGGPRITGETRYRLIYHFRSKSDWRVLGSKIVIRVRFRDVRWQTSHVIWFENRPNTDGFWDNQLVRHEFDHVEISTDPRIEKLFRSRLRDTTVIERLIQPGVRIRESDVDKIVEDAVREMFDEISELVEIRYKELDRLTKHGQLPLPPDEEIPWRNTAP